mmetsp:Transcript_35431/g.97825  ORF Transcript_35431/g.97825 Transcript_35431/m.97825 type:complete len:349 (-) Transcript_35431:931-1977(-)
MPLDEQRILSECRRGLLRVPQHRGRDGQEVLHREGPMDQVPFRPQAARGQRENVPHPRIHGACACNSANAEESWRCHRGAGRQGLHPFRHDHRLRPVRPEIVPGTASEFPQPLFHGVRKAECDAPCDEDRDGHGGVRLCGRRRPGRPRARRRARPRPDIGPAGGLCFGRPHAPDAALGHEVPEVDGLGDFEGGVQDGHAHRAYRRRGDRGEAAQVPSFRRHHQHGRAHDAEGIARRAAVRRGDAQGATRVGARAGPRRDRDEGQGPGDDLHPGPRRLLSAREAERCDKSESSAARRWHDSGAGPAGLTGGLAHRAARTSVQASSAGARQVVRPGAGLSTSAHAAREPA